MATRVVHCKRSDYDVYIGRGPDPKTGLFGIWGNPFRTGHDGDRADVIRKHREWLIGRADLMERIGELRGKVLGCWCAPLRCHGDTLAELADAKAEVGQKILADIAMTGRTADDSIFGEETPQGMEHGHEDQ